MKSALKVFLGVTAAIALSLAVTPVFAATTATQPAVKNGTAVKAVVQAAKLDLEALKTGITAKGIEVRKIEAQKIAALRKIDASKKDAKRIDAEQKTLNYVNDARNRLIKAVSDLESAAAQIDTRISALKTAGKDTTVAGEALALAKTNIQVAKDHITAFTDTQNRAVNAEKLADGIVIVGTALTDIETSLKTARQNLTDAVTALKALAPAATAPVNR